jgi:hypothetical protein
MKANGLKRMHMLIGHYSVRVEIKKTYTISFLSHDEETPKTNIFIIVFSIPSLH